MATTPLEKQARRIKQILRKEGVSETSIAQSSRDLGDWLDSIRLKSSTRKWIEEALPRWIAAGILTKRQAMAMTAKELETFYFRQQAIERYEDSKR